MSTRGDRLSRASGGCVTWSVLGSPPGQCVVTYLLGRRGQLMPNKQVNLVAFGGSMVTPIGTVTLPCRTAYI
jgi:hypothetical protein